MAAYDLEEQEQVENLKAWWQRYGNLVVGCVCVAALAISGYTLWNGHQARQSAQSGELYAALQQAIDRGEGVQVRGLTGELTNRFAGTPYASMGVLLAARYAITTNDAKTARAQLAWVAENDKDEFADIARLRLAGVLLDEKEYDEAIKQLSRPPAAAFAVSYADLRGDIFLAQEKKAEAKAAWEEAKALLEKGVEKEQTRTEDAIVLMLLQQKLDALGGAA
ncbi:MAG: tetratricopeptide repeat protein [Zoogloeaceae bacterium]|jgi:predicted negative regulator of RcsB-dependent stress response|nr:tetratricopeptide repeat protein [Zoogloeaceae bacterium]